MTFSAEQIEQFKTLGILETGLEPLSSNEYQGALDAFMNRSYDYRKRFLQKKLKFGFDGYSYLGQADSSNQGHEDQVHSYVMSDFFDVEKHPREMRRIYEQGHVIDKVRSLNQSLLEQVLPEILPMHTNHLGYMLSANYYPPNDGPQEARLTEHKDVSMITCFPFGIDQAFNYQLHTGEWVSVKNPHQIILFGGYLLEQATDIPALNHRVVNENRQKFRHSFAYFTIPRPGQRFQLKGIDTTSEEYFSRYLALFD